MRFIKEGTHIDFIGKRKLAIAFSLILIILGLVVFFKRGGENFGVDFSGGTLIQLEFSQEIPIEDIRISLKEIELGKSTIQRFGEGKALIIRTQADSEKIVLEKLRQDYPDNPFIHQRTEMVGPAVREDLRKRGLWALILSFMGIGIYVSMRFQFEYALGAVVALIHDILITMGICAIAGREITLPVLAGFLTLIGYSINDTIVVYDRIREDLRLMRKENFETIINTSINQTLSRTVLTTLTTLIAVVALFAWGGEVIHDFAFVLIVGIITGTYSSIFVASPLIVEWRKWKRKKSG